MTEDDRTHQYRTKEQLEGLLFSENLYVLMPDFEFHRWVQAFVDGGDQCVWAESPKRIVGFRIHSGRRTRYIYNAKSAWPGMENIGASGLERLRHFWDAWGLGDLSTPGAIGLRLAEECISRDVAFWRPPWQAYQDLMEHGVAGWVDLFMKYDGESCVALDMNSAYPSAAKVGMPSGRCTRLFTDEDEREEAWTFGRYEWRLSSDAGVVEQHKYVVLAVGRHDNAGAGLQWLPQPGASGSGWYTRAEAEAARNTGAYSEFEFRGGWGWSEVSSAFSEWTERMDAAKAAAKALGEDYEVEYGWVKRMSVAPFGRFFMDAAETHVFAPGDVHAEGSYWLQHYGGKEVELQIVKTLPTRVDPTKLPQLSIHVWTQTRVNLANALQLAHEAGWEIFMCAIDGIYAKPIQHIRLDLDYGPNAGQWKQKELFDVAISAAGTVKGRLAGGDRYVKMPGIPMGDKRRA